MSVNRQPDPQHGSFDEQGDSWQPILDGDLKEQALEAVQAIADRLHAPPPAIIPFGLEEAKYRASTEASLGSGVAGLAVLYAHLDWAGIEGDYDETAVRFLEQALDALSSEVLGYSLYGGFTGAAWVTAHLKGHLLDAEDEDPNEQIDNYLRQYLSRSQWSGPYDLIGGLVGLGVYALEQLPHPTAVKCLELIVDHFDAMAERGPQGITWLSSPEMLIKPQAERFPRGYYDLGVAHGVPGVIAFLGGVCAAGVATTKARALLDGAVHWLLAQQKAEGFPYWIEPGKESERARLAWCYGDPGIAATLLGAAQSVGETAWRQEALAIARRAVERPTDQSGVTDAALCHGATGLGHVFNRMFQATGEAWLKEAARFWFERALEMRRIGKGIAGFSAWEVVKGGQMAWVDDPGFLGGAAGIALALLAATMPIEPEWDRIMLLSIPRSDA